MIIEALQDPSNKQFQLLCPATIPLRPALFTYTQLMAEPKSRVGWYMGVRRAPLGMHDTSMACHMDDVMRGDPLQGLMLHPS